jgi:serine/threonine-protein kinase
MSTTLQTEPASPTEPAMIGGRYRVIRLLGKGGMGAVYEAENSWTKRRVAVKVMRPDVADRAEFVRRFMQEAQSATQLAHPNIVDVLDMGEDRELGSLYIVQAFLTGHDLRAHLDAAGRMPVRESLDLMIPVMEALIMAHGRGIVHRDLKPDNIFLAETPRGVVPTLIDFGIAKVASEDGSKTSTGMLMGTPYYMAPEQARGDTALDARADVWALGVVLYEMLSGQRPATAANSNALIAKIIYEDPRPLADAAPDLPADVTAAVMGALQRDVAKRYPSMQALLDALRACDVLRRESVPAAPTVLGQSMPGATSARASAPDVGPTPDTISAPSPTPIPTPKAERADEARPVLREVGPFEPGTETLTPQADLLTSPRGRVSRRSLGWVLGAGLVAAALAGALLRRSGSVSPAVVSSTAGPAVSAPPPVTPLTLPRAEVPAPAEIPAQAEAPVAPPVEAAPVRLPAVAPAVIATLASSDAGSRSIDHRPTNERSPRGPSPDSARPGAPVPPRGAATAGRPTLPTVRGTVPLE